MRVLITGVAGQDGTILAHSLEREGVDIVGLVKPGHDPQDLDRLRRYAPSIEIVESDLADAAALKEIAIDVEPEQIFNFGGISSITESIKNPELTRQINVGSVEAILEAMRVLKSREKSARLVAAASGTIFEGVDHSPQTKERRSPRILPTPNQRLR
jgi:GDPmannose 4,6-dehydratase